MWISFKEIACWVFETLCLCPVGGVKLKHLFWKFPLDFHWFCEQNKCMWLSSSIKIMIIQRRMKSVNMSEAGLLSWFDCIDFKWWRWQLSFGSAWYSYLSRDSYSALNLNYHLCDTNMCIYIYSTINILWSNVNCKDYSGAIDMADAYYKRSRDTFVCLGQ